MFPGPAGTPATRTCSTLSVGSEAAARTTGLGAVNAAVAPDVLAPARLGPVELRNRVIKAATFEGMAPRALVTDDLIGFHVRHARGGVGMTTVAYCAVSPEGRTDRHQIWMRPDAVPGLRRLSDAVHAEAEGQGGEKGRQRAQNIAEDENGQRAVPIRQMAGRIRCQCLRDVAQHIKQSGDLRRLEDAVAGREQLRGRKDEQAV